MSDPVSVIGPSGTEYPIEPLRSTFNLTRVEMVDAHLRSIVTSGTNREDTDKLLDARNEYSS